MKLVLVAAVARNGVIGRGNTLIWRLPADLKRFKQTTLGRPVVMGRKTWDSLPAAFKPLPGRRNVVVTRNPDWHAEGAQRAASLDEALLQLSAEPEVCIVGGGELYAAALPRADVLQMTEIDRDFDGDTFFPHWDRGAFVEISRDPQRADGPDGFDYAFVTYERRPGPPR